MKINKNITQRKTCFIYCRVATNQPTVASSIDIQKKRCATKARLGRMKVLGIYVDKGFSGMNLKRKGIKKLINDLKIQKPDFLIVGNIERISRNVTDYFYFKKLLSFNKTTLISCDQPDIDKNHTIEAVLLGINEFYSRQITKRIQEGINKK